jgi:RNA polymerase sigma-70 factor, ECF subfamily
VTEELTRAEIRDLYERFAPLVHRRAQSLLGDSAESWDVVHEVFERLLRHAHAFRREAQPMTWVYRATTNAALNLLRRRKVRLRPTPAPPEESEREADAVEARNLLWALVNRLDERALGIAALYFVDGLPQEEIERVVGLSRKTVGRVLRQVRDEATALAIVAPGEHA